MIENTTATRFLLRPLGIIKREERLSTSRIRNFGFIDAFVKDKYHETEYTHALHLLFKQSHTMLDFNSFIFYEYERGLLLEDYDYPEGYIVLVYDYPEDMKRDYDKILEGKYSETSVKFQNYFPESVEVNGVKQVSMYYRVFHKSQDLREFLEKKYGFSFPEGSEVRRAPYIDEVPDFKFSEEGKVKSMKEEVPSETLDINKYLKYEKYESEGANS